MRYTAIVPARSGSKRLPNKNIKELAGKPLFIWTLLACANAKEIDTVVLSTDSQEYWQLAKQWLDSPKLSLDLRDPEEAGDTVKIFDYIKDKRDKIFAEPTDAFVLTLPTVPLRRSEHIDEAITLFESGGKAVFSATNYGFPISFAFHHSQGQWTSVFDDSPMHTGNTRSQNQQDAYHPNGAIYVRKVADLDDPELMTFYNDATPYIMDRDSSVDIDNAVDFTIAEAILGQV